MGTPEAAPTLGERVAQMRSISARALSLQQRIQEQELDWLRSDINLLSAQVNRRHAFLTTVRDRARADADLCDQVQRRAALLRTSLEEQRTRERAAHARLLVQEEQIRAAAQARQRIRVSDDVAASFDASASSIGMFSRLLRTADLREQAWRSAQFSLEPFPLSIFEARVQTLKGDMPDDECSVCLHGMLSGDRVITLCCRHSLHWACIEPWLVRKRSAATCPKCKTRVLGTAAATDALTAHRNDGSETRSLQPIPSTSDRAVPAPEARPGGMLALVLRASLGSRLGGVGDLVGEGRSSQDRTEDARES